MDYKNIGKKISEKRILLNMTQEELAEKIDSSASYISNIETGVKKGSLIFYIKIANSLDISLDYLFSSELKYNKNDVEYKELYKILNLLNDKEKKVAEVLYKKIIDGIIELRQK